MDKYILFLSTLEDFITNCCSHSIMTVVRFKFNESEIKNILKIIENTIKKHNLTYSIIPNKDGTIYLILKH